MGNKRLQIFFSTALDAVSKLHLERQEIKKV
jgi:hypothetical protein